MIARTKSHARAALQLLRQDRALVEIANRLGGAAALEPGGPSGLFRRRELIPVYPKLGALDTLDFSERTIWTDSQPPREVRSKLIGEAGKLDNIQDCSYDAVLGSHVLEHIANPIGALQEWQRVVRAGGYVLLVMPHYEGTFDHRRPVTSIDHMLADAERGTNENDLTHLDEILELHDLERDPGAPGRDAFRQRCHDNPSSRAMHHHVFDSRSVFETCRAAGLEVLALRPKATMNVVCLCRVRGDGSEALGESELTRILQSSPFSTDRAVATGRA